MPPSSPIDKKSDNDGCMSKKENSPNPYGNGQPSVETAEVGTVSGTQQERREFERQASRCDRRQLSQSLQANEKLMVLFKEKKGEIPNVLEMMQDVLRKELERHEKPA